MLTLKQRQERAARRAARIAAKHEAIRQAAGTNHERSGVMKKHEVKVGSEYIAKVSGKLAHVRIDRENPHGGWDATNLATKKAVRIKSAQRLRAPAGAFNKALAVVKTAVKDAGGAKESPTLAHGAAGGGGAAKDTKPAPAAAKGNATNPLEAHYQAQKDAAVKAAEANRAAKKAKAAKPKGERKPSLLSLAADVLKNATTPMDCKTIVEKVLAKGLWKTKGKTPAATLYAAIIREIAAKGKDARFKKVERGQFATAR